MKKIFLILVGLILSITTWNLRAMAIKTYDCNTIQKEKKGRLFSGILLANTSFGKWWKKNYPQLQKEFPELNWTHPESLHITVVYIGKNWQNKACDDIMSSIIVPFKKIIVSSMKLSEFGPNGEILVMELMNLDKTWIESVQNRNLKLVSEGFKEKNKYDLNFRPHITLFKTPKSIKNPGKLISRARERIHKLEQINQWELTFQNNSKVHALIAGTVYATKQMKYIIIK